MKMDTFESSAVSGMFVTMRACESGANVQLVDELAVLRLGLYRPAYEFSGESSQSPFASDVMAQIVDEGYALHRIDDAFRLPASPVPRG